MDPAERMAERGAHPGRPRRQPILGPHGEVTAADALSIAADARNGRDTALVTSTPKAVATATATAENSRTRSRASCRSPPSGPRRCRGYAAGAHTRSSVRR